MVVLTGEGGRAGPRPAWGAGTGRHSAPVSPALCPQRRPAQTPGPEELWCGGEPTEEKGLQGWTALGYRQEEPRPLLQDELWPLTLPSREPGHPAWCLSHKTQQRRAGVHCGLS